MDGWVDGQMIGKYFERLFATTELCKQNSCRERSGDGDVRKLHLETNFVAFKTLRKAHCSWQKGTRKFYGRNTELCPVSVRNTKNPNSKLWDSGSYSSRDLIKRRENKPANYIFIQAKNHFVPNTLQESSLICNTKERPKANDRTDSGRGIKTRKPAPTMPNEAEGFKPCGTPRVSRNTNLRPLQMSSHLPHQRPSKRNVMPI